MVAKEALTRGVLLRATDKGLVCSRVKKSVARVSKAVLKRKVLEAACPRLGWPGASSEFMRKDGMGLESLEVNSIA